MQSQSSNQKNDPDKEVTDHLESSEATSDSTEIDAIENSSFVGAVKKSRLSKLQKRIILGVLLVIFTGGTLAGIPIGAKPNSNVRITLAYQSIAKAFMPLDKEGVVPKNIFSASVVPLGASLLGLANLDMGNGPFDREITFSIPFTISQATTFEQTVIAHMGWRLLSRQITPTGSTFYLQKSGTDGKLWEEKVNIKKSNIISLGATVAKVTISLRLLIVSFQ
ncbi:hypothetical protein [Acidithrix ferrooxidans]|uniref:Uncharacterized protein n=1 Tax=Acidithrix ferrooxidans TaxID=1280514 RepID=A0A0D8HCC8_9ACTN|nr:hypothetical protein [Acidithrix ferrooxidans]KJF15539.1 hypothetical protein AXFE_36190 [Acidithrix ferrooxidans]